MTSPRKTSPGSARRSRTLRAGMAPASGTKPCNSVDDALIAAAGTGARSILIVVRDQAGVLRVWCSDGDPLENLRLVEHARGELTVRALSAPQGT